MSLIDRSRAALDPRFQEPLDEKVQRFLHAYFQCESLALSIVKNARLIHNQTVLQKKLTKQLGKTLTRSRIEKIVVSLNYNMLKTATASARVHVDELKTCLKDTKQVPSDTLDLIFNTHARHRRKGSKSARVLRNEVVHGLSRSAQNEIINRFEILMSRMEQFKGQPL